MFPGDNIDDVDSILKVAEDVVQDYGPGTSRIQRMAEWLIANLGGEHMNPTWINQVVSNEPGEPSKTGPGRRMTSQEARAFAAALLRAADKAET